MKAYAIINAGGVGKRFGDNTPKQFTYINGRPIIVWCMEQFERNKNIDYYFLVMNNITPTIEKQLAEYVEKYKLLKLYDIFEGGETANESRYNGIVGLDKKYGCIIDKDDIIIFQDVVRLTVKDETINQCIKLANESDVCVTGRSINANLLGKNAKGDGYNSSYLSSSFNTFLCSMPFAIKFKMGLSMFETAKRNNTLNKNAGPQGFLKYLDKEVYQLLEIDYFEDFKITYKEDIKILENIWNCQK